MYNKIRVSLILLILMTACVAVPATAEVNVTFYGKAWHPTLSDLNENNDLIAIEYIDTTDSKVGYVLASYTNSYNQQAFMYTQSLYIPHHEHWETILSAGATTGYQDTGAVCIIELGDLCSVVSIGIQYSKYKFKPRVTIFGPALVFSLSYTF
jgi:hypothetical protein